MNNIDRLVATEQIKQTKARYFRFLDTKNLQGLSSVFAENAEMDMRAESNDGTGLVVGNRTIADFILGSVKDIVTVHHGHTPEIEFTSPTSANAIWAMEDKLWKPDDSPSLLPFQTMHGYGHYHETYVLIHGEWFIKTMTLRRLRVDVT